MKTVSFPREKIVETLRTLEALVVSLDRIGSASHGLPKAKADAMVAEFIRDHDIFKKVAVARSALADAFSGDEGADGMEDLERELQGVRYWTLKKKKKRANKRSEPTAGKRPPSNQQPRSAVAHS